MFEANKQTSHAFWLARLQKFLPSEPQIRDVCAHCNNIVLSELDSYICDLFDKYFIHIPTRDENVDFSFDYHLLKRWLLKVSFNCARIHDSGDKFALEALVPYILGKDDNAGGSAQLFLQLAYPEMVSRKELDPDSSPADSVMFLPDINRTGLALFRHNSTDQKVLRTVFLRSFYFSIAYWPPGSGRALQKNFERALLSHWPATRLLRPSEGSVQLRCSGVGAWRSYKGFRDYQFVFSDSDA